MTAKYQVHTGWTDEEWDAHLLRFPESTVFHSRGWARVVTSSFDHCHDQSLWLKPTNGAPSEGCVLPLHRWSRKGATTLHSAYPFVYGGTVPSYSPAKIPTLGAALAEVRTGTASVHITGNPFLSESAQGREDNWGLEANFERNDDTTHLRTLPAEESDFWEGELKSNRRNDVRRMTRRGVSVEEGGAEDVAAVYALYEKSFERWGGRPRLWHPLAYYEAVFALPASRLTVARYEGRVIGGIFALRWNGKVHSLAGYFDPDASAVRPNVLLHIESIRQAIIDGFTWYDYLPSGGRRAVEEFKEGFGCNKTDVVGWQRTGLMHRLIATVRR